MAVMPRGRTGPPPGSFAADAHGCDYSAVFAILPLRETRDDTGSNRLQLTQAPVGLRRRRVKGLGLNNSQYSRMCDASTSSVLLRPNLVRAKSRIYGA